MMPRPTLALTLMFALAYTGCLAEVPPSTPGGADGPSPPASDPTPGPLPPTFSYELEGVFSPNATQVEWNETADRTLSLGGEFVLRKSIPPQFLASRLSPEACDALRADLAARAYIAQVKDCRASVDRAGDDTGFDVSYVLRGVFTQNATQEEMKNATERVVARHGQMVLLESFPIMFHAWSLTLDACNDARAELEWLPWIARVNECVPADSEANDPGAPVHATRPPE